MGSIDITKLPYWQVNVPEAERTEACPEFLSQLSEKDLGIISTPDSDYHVHTWAEVQKIVAENRIDRFRRVPSELRRYLAYNWMLKQNYGSILNFVLTKRLLWSEPICPKGRPFEHEEDIRILRNDWPYGIDRRIVHLVIWTKFKFEEDPVTTDLTDRSRAEIESFVRTTFGSRISKDQYIWFKNWSSLKSVHAVEHFHVMLYDPDPALVDEITRGDVAYSEKQP